MAGTQLTGVLRHIHRLVGTADSHECSDAQLLQCFLDNRDERAFRLLVERHGCMVLNVCRHVLHQTEDAEDAFQATFLVLAQRAGSIRQGTALASWLYGVAYRTALKARHRASRRQFHERRAAKMEQAGPDLDLALRELQAVLAEEVRRLPAKFRAPFVLCCLEGKSRSEVARQLGWKEGSVFGRLAEARKLLQRRLARRGVTLAAALCAGACNSANAGVSAVLIRTTIQAARGVAAAPVAALAEGVMHTMFLGKVKWTAVLFVAAGLLAAGAGLHFHRAFATPAGGRSASTAAAPAADNTPVAKEDGKVVVNGRVLDPDGQPLAGARVFLPGAVWGNAQKGSLVDVKSGEDGRFRFTIDRAQLIRGRSLAATAKGHALDWIEAEKLGRGEVTLRLVKDLPIRGRVLDLEGRPVKGVRVSVRRIAASAEGDLTPVLKSIARVTNRIFSHPLREFHVGTESPVAAPVTTDAAGRFRFTGMGQERLVVLWVEGPTIENQVLYVLSRPELNVKELARTAPGLKTSPLPAMYGPTFEHTAGPTQPIVGVVRDKAMGKPVADATINGRPDSWWENYVQTKTDKEGRYRLIGLPKARSLHVWAYAVEQDYLVSAKSVDDRPGLGSIALDLELVHGVRVKGRITDKKTGKPVHAVVGYLALSDNKFFANIPGNDKHGFNSPSGWNKEDGSYSLLVPPGSGLLTVKAEVGGENPYMEVAIHHADRPKTYKYEGLSEGFVVAGGGMIGIVGENAYRLIDPAPDAKAITCDIPLERGQARTGKVVDPDGKPLTNVRVRGLAAPAALDSSKTLADGSFKAIALNPLRPRLIAFVHKERKLVGHVLLATDAKEPVTVRLQPGSVLTGRLLDEDGKPLAGITVSFLYSDDRDGMWRGDEAAFAGPVKTDAEGRFRVEGIIPGLKFGLGFRKDKRFFVTEGKYRSMTLQAGTKDLGDITAKPYRPE
jgi:RNA polymerase sigma factor (sigma-70 family)